MPSVNYTGTVEDYSKEPFTITSVGNTTVAFVKEGSPADITLEYRTGGADWASYTIGTEIPLTDGATLQFRAGEGGNSTFSADDGYDKDSKTTIYNDYKIEVNGDGTINASGNVMSLLNKSLSSNSLPDFAFYRLFYGCTNLIDVSNLVLPALELSVECYCWMFASCTNLTMAPVLPATSLGYSCYSRMFSDCTHLYTAPALPATTLAEMCYCQMFSGCTSLNEAPALPATTLAEYCYSCMFVNCTSLTTAPELPAIDLVEGCYEAMFEGCENLSHIKALFTTEPSDTYTKRWVSGVAWNGTFVKSKDATWDVTGTSGVPSGWTIETVDTTETAEQ